MKNESNILKNCERMWNVCLSYVCRMFIVFTLLFTLGVGQMWGVDKFVVAGDKAILDGTNDWNTTAIEMTNVSGNDWYYLARNRSLAKTTYGFKIVKNGSWDTSWPGSNWNITISTAGTYNIIYKYENTSSHTITANWYKTLTVAGTNAALGANWDAAATANDMTYSSGFVYTLTKTNVSLTAAGSPYGCKVCKDHAWSESWPASNVEFSVAEDGRYNITFTFNIATKTLTVTTTPSTYSITLNKNGGSANGSATATYNSTSLSSISAPTYSHYHVEGYYTNAACSTKVSTSTGALQASTTYTNASSKWTSASNQTLYAKWEGDLYNITYKDEGGSAFSGTHGIGYPTTHRYGTATALVSPTKSGYSFVGWYTTSACTGDAVTSIGATAKTADFTLYAKWEELSGGSVTMIAGTGGKVSANNSSWGANALIEDITSNTTVNIYAKADDGYTFNTWTKTSGTGSVGTNAASGTYNAIAYSAETVTASFTETKITLTPTVNYDHGTSTYTASSSNPVGVATTTDLSCSAPTAAHYTFAGWTLTNLTVTSGNAATDRNITVKINDPNGATPAAVANYNEVLTTDYVLKGGSAFGGTAWTTEFPLTKKSGHSTESVAYYTASLSSTNASGGSTNFNFKIINGANWYGLDGDGDWYYYRSSGQQTMGTSNQNIQICADVAGDYEIKVDYSTPASPKVTVTFPPSLSFSATSVYSGNASTLTASVSNVVSGKSIKYDVYAGATATGDIIATYTHNTSSTTDSHAFSITPSFGANESRKQYTVKITYNGTQTATYTGYIGRKWDIYVHDVQSWGMMKVHMWNAAGSKSTYPGDPCSLYNGSTSWYTVTLDGQYTGFVLSANGDATKTADHALEIATYPANAYYYVDNSPGGYLQTVEITDPTVTLSVTVTSTNQINLTGFISNFGGDGSKASEMKEVYFKVNNIKDAASITASTTDGNFTKTLNNPTPDNTNNNLQAFAENIHGTGSSSILKFTRVTLDNQSATSAGTANVLAVNGAAMASGASAPAKTGYAFGGYYQSTGGADKQYYNASMGSANNWDQTTATKTIYAKWTPITYYVSFAQNGGTGDDMDNQSFTYDVAQNLSANTYTRTGYTFDGWATSAGGTVAYTAGQSVSNLSSTANAVVPLFAHWAANNYTVTLDLDEAHKGTIADKTESQSVTYDAATTTVPLLPTAENGYGLEGYYTEQNGAGTKVIDYDGKWIASVDGYTDADKKWVHDGDVTLYAYYKKAEITSLVLTPSTQAPGESVTATPTIYPTPVGDKMLCWKLLRANGNPLADQPDFDATGVGNAVSFETPATSGSYKVACILRTGSSCSGGTVLDSVVADLIVAGEHTVTIRYQDGDGRTLAASGSITGKPLEWSSAINPETITGYTFHHWVAGDGVTLSEDGENAKTGEGSDQSTVTPIYIKATYDGTLTAVYTKKRMIYFYNTLNWENVYVYFYKNGSYWGAASQGTGANTGWQFDSYPYSEGKHGQMLPMEEGSKIYYFDAEAAGVNASYTNVAFTELEQHGCDYFWNGNKVARRSDYKSGSLPLFVPLADQTGTSMNGGAAMYYNDGYWMNYPDNTGYTLKIYSSQDATTPIRTLRFPFSEDTKMPLKLDVEFNSPGTTFYYTIYREDGDVLSADYGMNQNYHSDVPLTDPSKKISITTTATGIYTYTLVYKDSPSKNYFISVDYPIGQDDYRVWYSDNATWSQGSAHSGSWHHASDVIRKNTDAEVTQYDTVSFFVSQGAGISVTMKFQYASAIAEGGTITWTDVTSGGIGAADTISNAGVYNFIIKQVGTANPVVEKVEKYSGNYYIRTDNAGSTKWDYYRAADHQMTYSEFSKSRSTNTFGELYTHYYMHWCPRSTNIKFVIANDYSPCVSDTLESDLTDWGNLSEGAWLKSDGANPDYKDKYSANIRFMYNESTNKISRAYLSSSTNTDRKFLILRSNTKFWNGDGTDLSGTGETSDDENHVYEAIFQDNEDWIYEREIKLTPSSKFKLYASYAQAIPSENGSQYFRGAYEGNDWTDANNYVLLIGGVGSPCKARIIYDFKTNRLLAAYLPDNSEIDGTLDIDADLMIIREHQEAGQQITFKTNESQLTDVKTVYGVMRFNRWILNNRQHPEDHVREHSQAAIINTYHPLLDPGSQKSLYERALYWVSFPFDVNLSEVFGFGTYGVHWIMMDYNGAERARIGYWKDNDEGFWEYIEDRRGVTLKAGRGYVLALELELMQATDTINFWYNQIQQVELFFPSISSTTGTIKQTSADITVPDHECTIDRRTDKTVPDWNNDRRVADSHWNIIGVPSYANYGSTLSDGSGNTITWHSNPKTDQLPFLYEWNANDNTYTVQSGTRYNFKAMHAYYVQYAGTLHWTLASATPVSPIVARRTYAEEPEDVEFKLELMQNEKMIDQTFVKMSNDEEVSANFAFGEDLDKEFNAGKANVYTFIEGYIPSAGNTLPMSDETTIVPVGVKITSAGEYTFAIPEGTEGVGVTLIDNVAGTRTNLSALDYTVNLTPGTYDGRFLLEISPIQNAPTDIGEVTGNGLQVTGARKVLIDGILYIVKGDKLYDVRGTMVK